MFGAKPDQTCQRPPVSGSNRHSDHRPGLQSGIRPVETGNLHCNPIITGQSGEAVLHQVSAP